MLEKNNVIYDLYYGLVTPWENKVPKSKEYDEKTKQVFELEEKLTQSIGEESKKILEEFLNENGNLRNYFTEEKFKDGFILGAKLMIEVLQDKRFSK